MAPHSLALIEKKSLKFNKYVTVASAFDPIIWALVKLRKILQPLMLIAMRFRDRIDQNDSTKGDDK